LSRCDRSARAHHKLVCAGPTLRWDEELNLDPATPDFYMADHPELIEPATKVGVHHCSHGKPDVGFGQVQGLLQSEPGVANRTDMPDDQGVRPPCR
jgi:hypothetical protein